MVFATVADKIALEKEMPWADRDVPTTIYQLLTQTKNRIPKNNAFSYQLLSGPQDKSETLTWLDLHKKVTQTANLFRFLGINKEDVIAFILPNCNETIYTLLGGAVAGIVNPINPLLGAEQIGSILRETNAKIVVTLKSFPKTEVAQNAAQAVSLAPNVKTILEIDLNRYLTVPKSWLVPILRPKYNKPENVNILNFNSELNRHKDSLEFEDEDEDRVAALFHTGGTTGNPKVAQHRYSGLIYNGWLWSKFVATEKDNVMCPLPLFHVLASNILVMGALVSGSHTIFPTPAGYRGEGVFDNFWKLVERWKITFIIGVPTAISALMQRPVNANVSTVKTAFSGSAPLPVELFKRFEAVSGLNIIEGYGLTEATCLVSFNPIDGEKKIGSVGIALPYTDVKVIKEKGKKLVECEANEVGEICVSNPGVWAGNTYTDPEKNKNLYYKKEFLRTGDLGRLDEDMYLWITGRAKDLIIRGGHNIDPAIIEETLLGNSAVAFAGAIGQPDVRAGELPCVYIELVSGASISEEELAKFCEKNISERAAHPKYIEFLDELPKTAVGKVFKPELRKRAIKRVFDQVLSEANLESRVEKVIDDKKRGLVAIVSNNSNHQEINAALGAFAQPWERE